MLKVGDYFGENALLRDESGTSKGWQMKHLLFDSRDRERKLKTFARYIKWFQEYDLMYEHGIWKYIYILYYYMSNAVSDTCSLQIQDIFRTNVYHQIQQSFATLIS